MTDQATRLRQMAGVDGAQTPDPVQTPAPLAPAQAEAWANVRVIAITSGKGGVGKTNIAVNLAIAIKRMGHRVLVIDADLGMANVDVLLGAASRKHLLDLLRPDVGLTDVMVETPYGIRYISGGSGIEKAMGAT